ncbi:hypothetical protein EHQ92_08705 [Leptospira biflexa]|uniref:hypothetical protein n=1 Tax=Leptospira biflexa TaxID=172 RepID=UPI001090F3BC|nr:hypothetical protein [Leptospira biflexa]TGM47969.1 hypothetical protein EHQ92_08705 [Leptospira biflexa]TGM49566.1 hypothetical protein EHQ88_04380 [Leptospira biflexa]TGM54833.1 hypothetical protein EHQ91_07720 [Leptospira biflexa]
MKSVQWVICYILFSSFLISCFETKEKEEIDVETLVFLTALATPRASGPTNLSFSSGATNAAYVGFRNSTYYIGFPNGLTADITIYPGGMGSNPTGVGRISFQSNFTSPLTFSTATATANFERGRITGTVPAGVSSQTNTLTYTTTLQGGVVTNPSLSYSVQIQYDSNANLAQYKCKYFSVMDGCPSTTPYSCDISAQCTSTQNCNSLSECIYNVF